MGNNFSSDCGEGKNLPPNVQTSYKQFKTVSEVDFNRYSGRWYEISKFPFRFQIGCDDAMADYLYNCKTNSLTIVNSCIKNGQVAYSRYGVGTVPNPNEPGQLIVSFNDGLGPSDPTPTKPNYLIHYISPDYKYAIVGSNSPFGQQLWILARTCKIDKQTAQMLIKKVDEIGYDSSKLVSSPNYIV